MILADTSAWIEYLRLTGSAAHLRLRQVIEREEGLATTEPVVMEVLSGARDEAHHRSLTGALAAAELLVVGDLDTWLDAAALYAAARRQGVTIRSQVDCVIAAVAIREATPVLHHDGDFVALARLSRLQLARLN